MNTRNSTGMLLLLVCVWWGVCVVGVGELNLFGFKAMFLLEEFT